MSKRHRKRVIFNWEAKDEFWDIMALFVSDDQNLGNEGLSKSSQKLCPSLMTVEEKWHITIF